MKAFFSCLALINGGSRIDSHSAKDKSVLQPRPTQKIAVLQL